MSVPFVSAVGRAVIACLLVFGAMACAPAVGDACTTDSECGTGLTCDLATPDGYCTATPCRPGECPAEAVCVDFGAGGTWCMRACGPNDECREGLVCRSDLNGGPADLEGKSFCGIAP